MRAIAVAVGLLVMANSANADNVRLYAAGSLKAVLTEMTASFEAANPGVNVETILGASGLLRERIEKGEAAHVFASADTGHPQRLTEQGRTAAQVAVFARNELCALLPAMARP